MSKGWHYIYPIGNLESRNAIQDLSRFKYLIQHYFHFSVDIIDNPDLPALEELIPELRPPRHLEQLEFEINKMIPTVISRFRRINAPHIFSYKEEGQRRRLDLFDDFFPVPDGQWQMRRDLLIRYLDRSLGCYQKINNKYPQAFFSPMYWIAWVLNLPIRLLALSGVNIENEKTARFAYWLMTSLMTLILLLIAYKLGISTELIPEVIQK